MRTSFIQAVVWGLVGPKILFNELYPRLRWYFLIGYVQLVGTPKKITRSFSPSMMLYGLRRTPPYNLSYYIPSVYCAVAFMWQKYNFLFYSAITAGIAFSVIVTFFSVQCHLKDLSWWGNNVIMEGLDGRGGAPLKNATFVPDGYSGPRIGSFV